MITFDAPGADTKPGDYNGTYSMAINAWGAITGSYQDTNSAFHGFLRSPEGAFRTFEAPGAYIAPGYGTSPTSINDLGATTGSYTDANGFNHGFLLSPQGSFTTFDVPGVGGYGSFPIALNIEGAIVGYYTDSNYLFHAFLRSPDGNFQTFVGPGACDTGTSTGCYGSAAFNINFWGTIAGGYMDNNFVVHGLIRSPNGTLITYNAPGAGTLPGSDEGTGCPGCKPGLNQSGTIAGTYRDTNNVSHGFVRSPGGEFTTFDAPGAGTGSNQGTGCPSDCSVNLNDLGAIAGVYIDANTVYHGYLRSPAGKIVTVDPAGSIFTLTVGINDAGIIAGYYVDANGVYHGFLRIPE